MIDVQANVEKSEPSILKPTHTPCQRDTQVYSQADDVAIWNTCTERYFGTHGGKRGSRLCEGFGMYARANLFCQNVVVILEV